MVGDVPVGGGAPITVQSMTVTRTADHEATLQQIYDLAMAGADILKAAPQMYSSSVEYGDTIVARKLKDIAQIHLANLGTRIFYCDYGSFDSHANQAQANAGLLTDVSNTVDTFMTDLRENDASDNVTLLLFSEFGRRVTDNGSGTDHGSGGGAFFIGDQVSGGLYAEYPSIERAKWLNGEDMAHNIDFRGIYGTALEQWLGVEAAPVVGGHYEQINPLS